MSYDVDVWLRRPVVLEELLPESDGWVDHGGLRVRHGESWQILVGPLDRIEAEDVPREIETVIPGVAWLVGVTLEGSRSAALETLPAVLRQLAVAGDGAVEDRGLLITADGSIHRRRPARPPRVIDLLKLSWFWSDGAPAQGFDGLTAVVRRIDESLPEALPRRFGLTEPPQLRWEDEGLDGFVRFLDENRDDVIIWYPRAPVRDVDLHERRRWRFDPGFAVNRLTIDVDAAALKKRGWGQKLASAFTGIAEVVQPFYAEVRLLRGFHGSGRHLSSEPGETDVDPINGNLWRGLPNQPALAVALGTPYVGRWPALEAIAEKRGNLLLACPKDLSTSAIEIPEPPGRLVQRFDGRWEWFRHPTPGGASVPAVTTRYPDKLSKDWPF